MTWRYFTADDTGAADGLAFDEAMMLHYGRGGSPPAPAALRLYTYRAHCALVGRYQSLEDEIDLDYCAAHGLEVGRRPTGGGAILMGPAQLGVAITASANPEETPRQALRRYAAGVIAGLGELGVEARFRSKNDLEVGSRKIAGLGLYMDARGALLFHSSVLVDLDVELMLRVLRIPGAKLSDKAIARVEDRVTTIRRELGRPLTTAEVRESIATGVASAFDVELRPDRLDRDEDRRRVELVRDRYGAREWIVQRSPRRDARGSAVLKTPAGLLRIYAAVHGDAIKSVLITGDFNVLPPAVAALEARLKWRRAEREAVAEASARTLGPDDLGVEPEVVAGAIWDAVAHALGLQEAGHPKRQEGTCYFPEGPAAAAPLEAAKEST